MDKTSGANKFHKTGKAILMQSEKKEFAFMDKDRDDSVSYILWEQYSIYHFDDHEFRFAAKHGQKIRALSSKRRNLKYDPKQDNQETHVIGALGEFAYFRMLRRDPYKAMIITEGPDNGIDDLIYGSTIQIKTTRQWNHTLMLVEDRFIYGIKSDFYVGLVINLSQKKVRALGYISHVDLFNKREAIKKTDDRIMRNKSGITLRSDELKYIFHLPNECFMRNKNKGKL